MGLWGVALSACVACGGPEAPRTLVDETGDLEEATTRNLEGTTAAGPELNGSRWQWVEAHCTEGELDLASEGFSRTAEVSSDDQGLLFVYDQQFGDTCEQTIAQRARPGDDPDAQWRMEEQAVVTVGECPERREADRPGDVRRRGQFLEVYVQRSVWCNGLEVRMVYAPAAPVAHGGRQLARHYAAHFNRRDARRVTELFAANGSLIDPFTRTPTDLPMRYDGQAAIFEWFREVFANTPWVAMRVIDIEAGDAPGAFLMNWHYMDPRLDAPFGGRNRFAIAGGEIFETSIEITQQEVEVEGAEEAEPAVEAPAVEAPADPEAGDS